MDQGLEPLAVSQDGDCVIPGTIDDPLYVAAETAYAKFYELRYRYCGLTVPRGSALHTDKFRRRFYEIAQVCLDNHWPADAFVETVFLGLRKNYKYITPTDLAKPANYGKYEILRLNAPDELDPKKSFMAQVEELDALLAGRADDASTRAYVVSALSAFDAWFRIVILPAPPSTQIAELYGQAAHTELRRSPRLRAFVRSVFPDHMAWLEKSFGSFGDVIVGGNTT